MAMNFDTKDVCLTVAAGTGIVLGAVGVGIAASAKKDAKRLDVRVGQLESWQSGCIASGATPAFGAYTPGAGYDGKVIG